MLKLFNYTDPLTLKFDYFRQIESLGNSRLAKNYSPSNFVLSEQAMLSFYQKNESMNPSLFSSIFRRDWWPKGCYRILNRVFQYPRNQRIKKDLGDHVYQMIVEQAKWCQQQPDFRMAFISRQNMNKLFDVMTNTLNQKHNLNFKNGPNIWVCKGSCDDCYQSIIYLGDDSVFQEWYVKK